MRQQLIRQLRQGLGDESVQKADEMVRAHVADPAAQAATVDRFLDELDEMAPSDGGGRDRRSRSVCAPPAGMRSPRWSTKFDDVARRSARPRADHAGRRAGGGGHAC